MSLDSQVAAFYGDRLSGPPVRPVSVQQARRDADAVFHDKESWRFPIFSTCDLAIPPSQWIPYSCPSDPLGKGLANVRPAHIPIRLYTPRNPQDVKKPLPIMLYFHGGGFVMHNIASHDLLCRKLAQSCDCLVISTEYRLAPEHPWPTCMADAWTVLFWASSHGAEFGGDPAKIIVAGDSAGASISAVVSLMLRDFRRHHFQGRLAPKIGLQVLCYGPTGCIPDEKSASVRLYGQGGYVLPKIMMDWCMEQYVPAGTDPSEPYLNPGRARDLTELPPSLIITAECDPLRDDGEAYFRRLKEAGNASSLYRAQGMMHGFLLYWNKFDRAELAIRRIAEEIQAAFQ